MFCLLVLESFYIGSSFVTIRERTLLSKRKDEASTFRQLHMLDLPRKTSRCAMESPELLFTTVFLAMMLL